MVQHGDSICAVRSNFEFKRRLYDKWRERVPPRRWPAAQSTGTPKDGFFAPNKVTRAAEYGSPKKNAYLFTGNSRSSARPAAQTWPPRPHAGQASWQGASLTPI
jgi:hypothetical protein